MTASAAVKFEPTQGNATSSPGLSANGARAQAPQAACEPSQNGLLAELPHRHNVSRFRISYVFPAAETTGMPPRTQIGPPTFFSVSSIKPSDGSNSGSMALPVALSQIT